VQPNRVTWFVSGLAAWVAVAGQVTQGVRLSAVLTLAVAVVPTLIAAASFANPDAYWRTSRLDLQCLALAVAAVGMLLRSSGDVAIAVASPPGRSARSRRWSRPGVRRGPSRRPCTRPACSGPPAPC
jgi:hypothetical protein